MNDFITYKIGDRTFVLTKTLIIINIISIFLVGILIGHSISVNYVTEKIEYDCNNFIMKECSNYKYLYSAYNGSPLELKTLNFTSNYFNST